MALKLSRIPYYRMGRVFHDKGIAPMSLCIEVPCPGISEHLKPTTGGIPQLFRLCALGRKHMYYIFGTTPIKTSITRI
ncbi:OLC1v1005873C1 [Oldenlandia corymbosa var. corymbosa]|nr:OLC1v1005873C1 [Oldenlandia corymbosa var. corymbosa]